MSLPAVNREGALESFTTSWTLTLYGEHLRLSTELLKVHRNALWAH